MNNYKNFYLAMLCGTFFMFSFVITIEVGFPSWKFLSFGLFGLLIYILTYRYAMEKFKFALVSAGDAE
ncbi:MAG: hypothetical protein ACTSQA_00025 [Candidatus Heimdallarchaeaceae archaeon]